MPQITAPVKLGFRTELEHGVIRATMMRMDNEEPIGQLGSLSLIVAQEDRESFDIWQKAMGEIFRRLLERETGCKTALLQPARVNRN